MMYFLLGTVWGLLLGVLSCFVIGSTIKKEVKESPVFTEKKVTNKEDWEKTPPRPATIVQDELPNNFEEND